MGDATERCCKEPPMSRRLRRGRNPSLGGRLRWRVVGLRQNLPLRHQAETYTPSDAHARALCGDISWWASVVKHEEVAGATPPKKVGIRNCSPDDGVASGRRHRR